MLITIIVLLAGCDDGSLVLGIPINPTVAEAPCNLVAMTEAGTIYFSAEVPTASSVPRVYTCTERDIAVLPVACERSSEFRVEGGVARVLCGTFTERGLSKADFVRIEFGGEL